MEASNRTPGRSTKVAGSADFWNVAALVAVMFTGSTLVTPFYVVYRQVFGFSEVVLTLIYAVYAVGNLGALLLLGRLSDQIGRRPIGLAALALAALATVFFLVARGTAWLFWGRLLSGFAIGLASGTSAAWLGEMDPSEKKARATLMASSANFIGLAVGPLLSGMLIQYAPWPRHLSYVVYLVGLCTVAVLVVRTRETVDGPARDLREVSLRPRLGVPPDLRGAFIPPAIAAFGIFALLGFYSALIPSVLHDSLHQASKSVSGAVVFELFLVSALTLAVTRMLGSRTAMLAGLVLLLPSLALLVLAQAFGSLAVLIIGTLLSGIAGALGYRGSLQVVNRIAPADRRSEVVSSYYVATFLGNSVPVIGVGILTVLAGSMSANVAFACTISVFAIAALVLGCRRSAVQ